MKATQPYKPKHMIRIVTATSLFDGHDASINIMRRILQSSGAEVIHLGHNRSAEEIVNAAVQEDAQAVAVSSYQGGHMEFFKYMRDLLDAKGARHVRIFGGGGGVIVPGEVAELHTYGITRIYTPDDGTQLGLQGIINHLLENSDFSTLESRVNGNFSHLLKNLKTDDPAMVGRLITAIESGDEHNYAKQVREFVKKHAPKKTIPVIGITGTGGAGKSSLVDELMLRFLADFPGKRSAVLSIDPSKRKTGGALLGDRIRMNSLGNERVFMRSLATRGAGNELSKATREAVGVLKAAGFDLIVVETSGIGQAGTAIVDLGDVSVYVMTSEFGAQSQLEKIDMIDFADLIVINKFERRGSLDALRDVRKQYRRGRQLFDPAVKDEDLPVFGTIASQFNDTGVNRFYAALLGAVKSKTGVSFESSVRLPQGETRKQNLIVPQQRLRYLAEIAETVRDYKQWAREQSATARRLYQLHGAKEQLKERGGAKEAVAAIDELITIHGKKLDPRCRELLDQWSQLKQRYQSDTFTYPVRDKQITVPLTTTTLSGTRVPKVALPRTAEWGEILGFLLLENLPGDFPYTAGVYPFKRTQEDPKRQFAGEGPPERTNKRFHYLTRHEKAKRMSVAFDSVTLYGEDPHTRPDIYGKVGESGVSICTVEDMQTLFKGFDLCDAFTSVSMTINGPAPIILAMFMNAAIAQQVEKFTADKKRAPKPDEHEKIRAYTLSTVRGTVQADILKEDQAQNTCIFNLDFALRMMGDVQQYFIDKNVRNFYSVSISGYHIAEAGANPVTQVAFTMANGLTYVEYYLSRGMKIDDFAPNLSFFFSNGIDAEYSVIGRVARRIWAVAMRNKYKGNARSQMLKYHIQTSGRSLHAQEIEFNDIRTTLQALMAIYDNCNSLHTNAYDEAITTPTEESVRRAMAIQMIINHELGLAKNENPLQGSFIIEELTELVEEAVLAEFERISERGGVTGAMETQYQRGKIQEESLYYEQKKNSGELPIMGVNTFFDPDAKAPTQAREVQLTRSTEKERKQRLKDLAAFHKKHAKEAPAALARLKTTALSGGNIFAELMETVNVASLGQISRALYECGGQYRRSM